MQIIVFGLVSFVILSMWCGVMDILYDIRRDVKELKSMYDDESTLSESVHGQCNSRNESYESKNM